MKRYAIIAKEQMHAVLIRKVRYLQFIDHLMLGLRCRTGLQTSPWGIPYWIVHCDSDVTITIRNMVIRWKWEFLLLASFHLGFDGTDSWNYLECLGETAEGIIMYILLLSCTLWSNVPLAIFKVFIFKYYSKSSRYLNSTRGSDF